MIFGFHPFKVKHPRRQSSVDIAHLMNHNVFLPLLSVFYYAVLCFYCGKPVLSGERSVFGLVTGSGAPMLYLPAAFLPKY